MLIDKFLALFLLFAPVLFASQMEDSFTDPRDGKAYKTVKIGNQVWMAENLNFGKKENGSDKSFCYGGNERNCTKFGRLYTWNSAQDACPSGWHLPTLDELKLLLDAVGDRNSAGVMLKASTGWKMAHEGKSGNGEDSYEFSALPAGYYRGENNDYRGIGNYALFWTSTAIGADEAYYLHLDYAKDDAELRMTDKNQAQSVRCVLNPPALIDERDGKEYKTVLIGSQLWMAENLNYDSNESFCYGNDEDNCRTYGRLYRWNAAVSVCPSGWYLPSKNDFETLIYTVGGPSIAGKKLKSSYGWDYGGNGNDDYGFSALPAGSYSSYYYGDFYNLGSNGYFWTSSESSNGEAYYVYLRNDLDEVTFRDYNKKYARPVRCISYETGSGPDQSYVEEYSSTTETSDVSDDEEDYSSNEYSAYVAPSPNYVKKKYESPKASNDYSYESVPTNIDSKNEEHPAHPLLFKGSAGLFVGGGILGAVGAGFARGVFDREPANADEYRDNLKKIRIGSKLELIGIVSVTIAILGIYLGW